MLMPWVSYPIVESRKMKSCAPPWTVIASSPFMISISYMSGIHGTRNRRGLLTAVHDGSSVPVDRESVRVERKFTGRRYCVDVCIADGDVTTIQTHTPAVRLS